jgi:peptide/nickel transport system permease protein
MSEAVNRKMRTERSALYNLLSRLYHNPLGFFGLILVVIVVGSAIFADWIVPYDPIAINIRERLQGPSAKHLMGTDQLGRDVFSRIVMGSRIALKVALVSITLALSCGMVLGLIAGYGPGWLDKIIILIFDTIRSFPTIMFALAIVTLVGPSLETVILVVVITTIPVYGRIVRTQTQSIKNNEFILAERAMGASIIRILSLHMLPNIIGP